MPSEIYHNTLKIKARPSGVSQSAISLSTNHMSTL